MAVRKRVWVWVVVLWLARMNPDKAGAPFSTGAEYEE